MSPGTMYIYRTKYPSYELNLYPAFRRYNAEEFSRFFLIEPKTVTITSKMSVGSSLLKKSRIFEVILDDFDALVLSASHQYPVLVDFWAEWCPPCITLAPVLDKVIHDYDQDISLAKLEVDVDDNMKLAGHYAVRGFPTVILFQSGEEKGRFSSMQSPAFIKRFIAENLSQDSQQV